MKSPLVYILVVTAAAALVFFLTNSSLRGYLGARTSLAKELKSPPDSIDRYNISTQAPFKYRLLFPAIVKGTYRGIYSGSDNEGFFATYKTWSLVFYITSALSMFLLLMVTGFSRGFALAGSLIFLLLPPMIMAFTLPVHTREDTLGYTLFFLGLAALVSEKRLAFLILSLLAALTRETLLLLPMLYFFFSGDRNIPRRLLFSGLPCVLWLVVRLVMGQEKYDVWEGLRWNLDNPEQVVGFLFITFNVCWIPFLMYLFFFRGGAFPADSRRAFFYRSALFTLTVILVTTFVGGIYNEIRLIYLFVPWVLVIFLDFVYRNSTMFLAVLSSRPYWMFAGAALCVCSVLMYFVLVYREQIIIPGKYNVPYAQWIVFSIVYIFKMLLFIPPSLKVLAMNRSAK